MRKVQPIRLHFGLPPADLEQSSGVRTGTPYEAEAVFDATWAGAVAPGARVFLAVASDPLTAYRLLIASNAAAVISSSIDICAPRNPPPGFRAEGNRIVVGDNGTSLARGYSTRPATTSQLAGARSMAPR